MRWALPILLLLVAGCLQHDSDHASDTAAPRLAATSWPLDSAHAGAEPSIAVAPDGDLYVCSPTGLVTTALDPTGSGAMYRSSHVWRSTDGGRNWTWLDPSPGLPVHLRGAAPGGGDCDIAVGPDGTVYVVDLTAAGTSIAVSADRGATWKWTAPFVGLPGDDRQWIVAGAEGSVYVLYHELGSGLWLAHSSDGGTTFPDHHFIVANFAQRACGCSSSKLVVSADGQLLATVWYENATLGTAVSEDGGATWRIGKMPPTRLGQPVSFPALALDADGTLAAAWVGGDGTDTNILFSTSADQGRSWSPPQNVSGPGPANLPWISALGGGRFAVTFARQAGQDWNIFVAVTAPGAAPAIAQLSVSPALQGEISRPLGDFFENAVTADGHIVTAWTSDLPGQGMRMWFGVAGATAPTWPQTND